MPHYLLLLPLLLLWARGDIFSSVRASDLAGVLELLGATSNMTLLLGATDGSGDTPLLAACRAGTGLEVVRALLRAGADPLVHNHGLTCLHLALVSGSAGLAQALVPRLPLHYLEAPDPFYMSGAVHWAAARGLTGVIDQLLRFSNF
jgi:hypothetical protein